MKVIEKGTDRRAEVHIYVGEQVDALGEYGEYIDLKDKAICCYVPVEEGHQLKFGGRFSGTTLAVVYDASVDGVLRKASSYIAKTVNFQKGKKLDVENFLYKTDKGIIDTEVLVAPLEDVTTTQSNAHETIGTLEIRLYITRQLDVSHTIRNVEKYYTVKGNIEDEDEETEQHASYKLLPPTFRTTFEKNSAPLDHVKVNREQKRMNAARPETEPWVIFRFHYRSIDAILEEDLKQAFDPSSKEKTEPHGLVHDPVPPLVAGTKPQKKDDGDTSTRAGSPMPPGTPSTPAKGAQSAPRTSTPTKKKPGPQPKSTPVTKMTTSTEKAPAPASETSTETSPESSPSPEPQENGIEDLRAKVFSKPTEKPAATDKPAPETDKAATNGDADSVISASTANGETDKPAEEPVEKPVEKEPAIPKDTSSGSAEEPAAKASSPPDPSAKTTNGTVEKSTILAKETVQKPSQAPVTLPKKPIAKPTPTPIPVPSTLVVAQKKPATLPIAATPAKRPAAPVNGATPEPKRTRVVTGPIIPSTQPQVPRIAPRSPTPKTVSVERQLTEQRKKLEELRKRRLEVARKQEAIDAQMTPYKQRMADELERLNQEMMDEEMAYTEEEQHYSASVEILQEFRKADGGA